LLLLPIGLVLSIIQRLAQYHLITRSTGVLASIAAGWQMFRQNFTANFVIALIMWGISFGLSIVVGAITGIIGVPVALLSALGSGSANQLLSAAVLLPVAILGLITLALSYTLGTGYTIFTNAIWLQAYHHNSEHTTI
jgi:ABC-type spermidine/putrescine transport system permease subunit I